MMNSNSNSNKHVSALESKVVNVRVSTQACGRRHEKPEIESVRRLKQETSKPQVHGQ